MRIRFALLLAAATATAAYAYELDCSGDFCKVSCDDGQYIGSMHKENGVWSNGLFSDRDKSAVARRMVKNKGGSCS